MGDARAVGRDLELARVDELLEAAGTRLDALAITGPAGIGKTTVWLEGVSRARELNRVVLVARPSEVEAQLSFAGLGDLLEAIETERIDALTALQRRALDVALLRTSVGDSGVDGRAVASGLLTVLRELARERPVVLAVDDAQWLDAATSEALAFAVRRLEMLPVGILASVRVGGARPETFERAVPAPLRAEIELRPMSLAAVHDVLERHLGLTLPRPLLVRIATACDGNPFYALEITRELARTGLPRSGPLPVPGEVQALVRTRIGRLPPETRDALLVASCLSRPTTALVDVESLIPAEEQGVVAVDEQGRIRFGHPLLASAVYDAAPAGRRKQVHRRLAEQVEDPEERARHLSLVTEGPDEDVAAVLDSAAAHAAARGASAGAADLARRALELSSDRHGEQAVRRTITLAHHLLDAGDSEGARGVLETCDAESASGDVRAELLTSLGRVCWYERDFDSGYAKLVEALEHAREPELAARIHVEAAWIAADGRPEEGIEHADAVLDLVDADRNPGLYSKALLFGAYLRFVTGRGADGPAYERGVELQENVPWDEVSPVTGMWPLLMDDFERARAFYEAGLVRSRAEGDELSVQGTLVRLVEIELWTGDWARADRLADEGIELADRIGSHAYLGSALYARAYVDAHLGRVDAARAAGERMIELFSGGVEAQAPLGPWILGLVALSEGDPSLADEQLSRAAVRIAALGQREPARYRLHPDLVEAVVQIGDLERAERLLGDLEERARICPRPWILATSARCRGLLLAARGDLDGARSALREALEHHSNLDMPFERARTLLVWGQLLRRRKERREARAALEEALAAFESLGATLWAGRAQEELARVPVRRAAQELTPTEKTIAELASTGLTNRAIAERVFVSPKTVEANLARVYRKLGIGSRAELGRAIAEREQAVR